MSVRQSAGVVSCAMVLAVAALGLGAASDKAPEPDVAAAPPIPTVTIVAPVAPETIYQWPGIIAADRRTGNLRSDLGWINGAIGETAAVVHCGVATRTGPPPLPFGRVLQSPNSPIVGKAAWVYTDCLRAFHQWDSLEAKTNGKWPAKGP